MTKTVNQLSELLQTRLENRLQSCRVKSGEVTIEVAREDMIDVCTVLRDDEELAFEMLIDLCGVDYVNYEQDEWITDEASGGGFSRGVDARMEGRLTAIDEDLSIERPFRAGRFAVVYHLLSIRNNQRLRLRVFAPEDALPIVDSVTTIWNSANWFEREAFDLYGIMFEGHPDLRRILTDYGFVGHPFRKDFPLSGNVEVIYDAEKRRVVYQPVSIQPRVLVPRVIREPGQEEGATGENGEQTA